MTQLSSLSGVFALPEVDDDLKVFTILEALFFKASRMGFNRTSVGWKRPPGRTGYPGSTYVLIEPVWDGNIRRCAALWPGIVQVLIEPVWDGNRNSGFTV